MARRKPPAEPLTETQTRAKRAIVDGKVTKEIVRDAFLEGKDDIAVQMIRQMDGKDNLRAGAKQIKRAEESMRNTPSSCYGMMPRLRDLSGDIAVAGAHLDALPHELRAPNSKLFGRLNQATHRLQEFTQIMQDNCTGGAPGDIGNAFANLGDRRDPRSGIPYGDVPLEGPKKRSRR